MKNNLKNIKYNIIKEMSKASLKKIRRSNQFIKMLRDQNKRKVREDYSR